jgi:hypothetical protein
VTSISSTTNEAAKIDLRHAFHAVLLAGLLALAACSSGVSARECSFARPLVLSHQSIAGLDPEDARAILAFNRTVAEVCK